MVVAGSSVDIVQLRVRRQLLYRAAVVARTGAPILKVQNVRASLFVDDHIVSLGHYHFVLSL